MGCCGCLIGCLGLFGVDLVVVGGVGVFICLFVCCVAVWCLCRVLLEVAFAAVVLWGWLF